MKILVHTSEEEEEVVEIRLHLPDVIIEVKGVRYFIPIEALKGLLL